MQGRVKGSINLQLDIQQEKRDFIFLAIIKSTTTDSWQIYYKMINDCISRQSADGQHSREFSAQNVATLQQT